MQHSNDTILSQGLTLAEYDLICQKIGREPNAVELGIFAVMWSEHCSYKSSRIHLKRFPTQGPRVLQGPGENAGVVSIGDGWALAFKMESHNHPSFIEPYQGAATGVGGILRDVFTMGARPICNLNSLRFGEPSHPKTAHLVGGVVAGIAGYGNCMGIPTVGGEVYFDACYNGNILVNAMTVGLVRADKIYRGTASGLGNPVVYVGSKTGRDGIHGATMASDEFSAENEEKRPTVQVGDPFTEKLLMEACLELMDKLGVIVGIQDMGAAGLTSSSFEMASRAGTGLEIDLDKVPQRETGMTAYELLLSESQERMLMVVAQGKEAEALAIFEKWGLDACTIGRVVPGNRVTMRFRGETVVDLPVSPVTDEAPLYDRPAERPTYLDALQGFDARAFIAVSPSSRSLNAQLLELLASPNLVSRRAVWEQYDYQVMTNTVVTPGSDAAVLRIKGTALAVAVTANCNSRYCYLDPRAGAKIAVAESARNLAVSGATPLAITDCLNFGNPERPEIMWQFKEAVAGLSEACEALGTPVVSGNVSFYNETNGTGIYPTPTVAMVGVMPQARPITQWFQRAGDVVYLLGETRAELGGSEYLAHVWGKVAGRPPRLDLKVEQAIQHVTIELIRHGWLRSAHDTSDGGLAVALVESCLNPAEPGLGVQVELAQNGLSEEELLFSESQSRILISVAPDQVQTVEDTLSKSGISYSKIGEVSANTICIGSGDTVLVDIPTERAREIADRFPI